MRGGAPRTRQFYGEIVTSNLSPEASIAYAPPGIQSYLTFTLKDGRGNELDMKGSRISMVLSIRKDVQQFI